MNSNDDLQETIFLWTDWFAGKNIEDTVIFVTIFITGTKQVRSITDNIVPLQSGSVFYEPAKLTDAQYRHRFILDRVTKEYVYAFPQA